MAVEAREFSEDELLMVTQRLEAMGDGWSWEEETALAEPASLRLRMWVTSLPSWAPLLSFPPHFPVSR